MNEKSNKLKERAFTLPEVALAIGVVALGLVAVFSVLPFGLTAQKDNQEETIIRYEAQYWREALLSNGLLLEGLKRVDRVEVHVQDDNTTHSFINPYRKRLHPQSGNEIISYEVNATTGDKMGVTYQPNSLALMKAKKYWSSDVQGWLLNPISETGPEGNFALVRSLNGSLFDRFYGAEPERDDYHFPNRDFSNGYILQVQAATNALTATNTNTVGSHIKLTFYWPLFEGVTDLLEPKPTAQDPKAKHNFKLISDVVEESLSGGDIPPFKSKEFTIRVPGRIEKALTEDMLTLQERRFMKELRALRPGEPIERDDPRLKGIFTDYYSFNHTYTDDNGIPLVLPEQTRKRRMFNNRVEYFYKVEMPGGSWVNISSEYADKEKDPSFRPDKWLFELPRELETWSEASTENTLSPIGHSGMWLHTYGYDPIQIGWVRPDQLPVFGKLEDNGSYALSLDPNNLPYSGVNTGDLDPVNHYKISFLGHDQDGQIQSWEDLLRDYAVVKPSRPSLVVDAGDHFVLSQRLRITTHRPAAPDEKKFNEGFPLWDKVPDEKDVPRLWRVGR
tara:strand:+ start:60 stop:1742 length:1683 start_codon:yes stop_codon:yes gene_type:complete